MMKAAQPKAKVVVRKLPPNLAEADFVEFLEKRLGGIYNWLSFYPGKTTYGMSVPQNPDASISVFSCDTICRPQNNFLFISSRKIHTVANGMEISVS